jgi:hypothetical protein
MCDLARDARRADGYKRFPFLEIGLRQNSTRLIAYGLLGSRALNLPVSPCRTGAQVRVYNVLKPQIDRHRVLDISSRRGTSPA